MIDPLGLIEAQDVVDGIRGFGDTVSFGLSGWLREKTLGDQGAVLSPTAYGYGEVAGIVHGMLIGGATGLRAAGTKAAGMEFSHFIPNRALSRSGAWARQKLGDKVGGKVADWLRKGFGRSRANGNYVTPRQHYMHDPFRFPKGWRNFGPRYNLPRKIWDRAPQTMKGALINGLLRAIGAGIYEPESLECGKASKDSDE